jgi:hypothetical protein
MEGQGYKKNFCKGPSKDNIKANLLTEMDIIVCFPSKDKLLYVNFQDILQGNQTIHGHNHNCNSISEIDYKVIRQSLIIIMIVILYMR